MADPPLPSTLGELKRSKSAVAGPVSVKAELRANLVRRLQAGRRLFEGIVGYEETVIPGIVNAILSRHNFILLGLRGQAKSRILRGLTELLDERVAAIAGSEINDDPLAPISAEDRRRVEQEGDELPIVWLERSSRYVEKLATPDVTVADIVGDLDPIKAARAGSRLSAVENMHFGLLPRAHRGIFAINELPDLAPKIQVALFNIMQEGDVQIKGFPVRLPIDVLLVFTANPEDYTARGKIITPLKDRLGSEIRTHYPEAVATGVAITKQEAWLDRRGGPSRRVPGFIAEIVERIAFEARSDSRIDHRSGVSQRLPITTLEAAVSNAERRALIHGEAKAVVRVSDVREALPAVTGKLELEYEGELKGPLQIGSELIDRAVASAFDRLHAAHDFAQLVGWFNLGGQLKVSDLTPTSEYAERLAAIQGVDEILATQGLDLTGEPELAVSALEFVLEGLCGRRELSRSAEKGFYREAESEEQELFVPGEEERSFN